MEFLFHTNSLISKVENEGLIVSKEEVVATYKMTIGGFILEAYTFGRSVERIDVKVDYSNYDWVYDFPLGFVSKEKDIFCVKVRKREKWEKNYYYKIIRPDSPKHFLNSLQASHASNYKNSILIETWEAYIKRIFIQEVETLNINKERREILKKLFISSLEELSLKSLQELYNIGSLFFFCLKRKKGRYHSKMSEIDSKNVTLY